MTERSRRANLIGWNNGGGLTLDMILLGDALTSLGWSVSFNGISGPLRKLTLLQRIVRKVRNKAVEKGFLRPPFDVNFHIESIPEEALCLAPMNLLVPNQEWLRDDTKALLDRMDLVLVKTRHAEDVFRQRGLRVEYVGWTSKDRFDPAQNPGKYIAALHVAGASMAKGTDRILDVWERHPEWPVLTVVRAARDYDDVPLPWPPREERENIRIISERLSDDSLAALQNMNCLHLATSEAEGYGHVISEALSVGALVVTTDAPPMNELVTTQRGVLVDFESMAPLHLGARYYVDRGELENSISSVLSRPSDELQELRKNGRRWFEENQAAFPERLSAVLQNLRFAK